MQNKTTAIAILIGFGLVAGAIFFTGYTPTANSGNGNPAGMNGGHQQAVASDKSPMREENRHIYGNVDAQITVVEFSDYECPFCSRLHPTLERLVDESEGKINWEYRHLPLPSHRNAELAAAVGECVGRIKGNDAFWSYSDTVFKNQKSVNNEFLSGIALDLGVSKDELQSCVNTDEVQKQVATDLATARALGGSGTPFNVIVFPDGSTQNVSGALPYESWVPLLNI